MDATILALPVRILLADDVGAALLLVSSAGLRRKCNIHANIQLPLIQNFVLCLIDGEDGITRTLHRIEIAFWIAHAILRHMASIILLLRLHFFRRRPLRLRNRHRIKVVRHTAVNSYVSLAALDISDC